MKTTFIKTRHNHLRRHSGSQNFYLWFKFKGTRHQFSLNTTDEALATVRRDAEIKKIQNGTHVITVASLTVDTLIARFLDHYKTKIDTITEDAITQSTFDSVECGALLLRREKPTWLDKPAGKLNETSFDAYLYPLGKAHSPTTYNRVVDLLKRSYDYGVKKQLVATNVAAELKRAVPNPSKSDATLTDAQYAHLIEWLKNDSGRAANKYHVVDLVEFLASFGFRINQARHIQKCDVELFDEAACANSPIKGQIRVRKAHSKRGKHKPDAFFPIITSALPLIKKLLARPTMTFFGEVKRDQYLLPIGKAYKLLNRAYEALGFPEEICGHHHFRHLAATRWIEAGVNIKVVSALLGHADIKITLNTYTHVRTKGLEQEMSKLTPEAPTPFTPEQIAAAIKHLQAQTKIAA